MKAEVLSNKTFDAFSTSTTSPSPLKILSIDKTCNFIPKLFANIFASARVPVEEYIEGDCLHEVTDQYEKKSSQISKLISDIVEKR